MTTSGLDWIKINTLLGILIGILGPCNAGCAGITKDFRAGVRFGWSPLTGAYYESTKDVQAKATVKVDPDTQKVTEFSADFSSLASTVNPTIVPIQQGYIQQMQVNATLQMHVVDKMTESVDRLSRMLENVLQAAVSPTGLKLGSGANQSANKEPMAEVVK